MMKLAPKTFRVRFRTSSSDLVACSGVKPDNCSMPRPPALETAAASGGLASDPNAAICIGTLQPVSSVNLFFCMRRQGGFVGIYDLGLSPDFRFTGPRLRQKRGYFQFVNAS